MRTRLVAVVALAGVMCPFPFARASIVNTVHNLSASGPGTVKAPAVTEVCSFCHTPHRAGQTRALWNRDLPPVTYKVYESSTLEATLNQPTGAARLCLSCHDGTTALGALRVPPRTGPITLGPLTGRALLGTDLSDDHPISFVYDSALALKQGQLLDPSLIQKPIRVDDTGQVQCTSCHEPHSDQYRKFLRVNDRYAGLCMSCHRQKNWTGSTHSLSTAIWNGSGANPWPTTPYTTVAENACENCHRPHSAPHPARLLSNTQERSVCLVCHNAAVTSKNIEQQFLKLSVHPIPSTDWVHDPREDPNTMARHVVCQDCHNPHQVIPTDATAPLVPGRLRGVRGLTISGSATTEATYLYEVCLECHGVRDQATTPSMVRFDNVRNVRLEISPSNPSYHPVAAVGKYPGIQDLDPSSGYSSSSLIYCTDCHNNDQWVTGGLSPKGPHGSQYEPILEREFQQNDPSVESYQSYALCYKCHSRSVLLSGQIRFPHDKHLLNAQASCAACHDAHGSRQNIRLINFMLRDTTGKVVVSPNQKGVIQFVPTDPGRGYCSLSCHGQEHDQRGY